MLHGQAKDWLNTIPPLVDGQLLAKLAPKHQQTTRLRPITWQTMVFTLLRYEDQHFMLHGQAKDWLNTIPTLVDG